MPSTAPLSLRSIRSFYVGGSPHQIRNIPIETRHVVPDAEPRAIDMNGSYTVGQIYVQEYRLANPRHPYPVLLWHGGGMCGSQWEATPDQQDGWLWLLLQSGFDVMIADGPERGRSSWLLASQDDLPVYRSKEEAWSLFRIGPAGGYAAEPAQRNAFAGQQFPCDAFDDFSKQFVPRWTDHMALEQQAYEALVSRIGPCILIGHSQGGGYALRVAQRLPSHVKAVVALEPTGMPDTSHCSQAPHLAIWGDHIEHSPLWQSYRKTADAFWQRLGQTTHTALIDLPRQEIHGNSHFLMLDRNTRQIAGLMCQWLHAQLA